MNLTKVYAEDNIKGKVLAGWEKDGVFYKDVTRAKHYFRLISGYAIQKETFDKLVKRKFKLIKIHELDTGKVLSATIDTWLEHGSIWTGKNGRQRTLSEKYMEGYGH